jgi:alpha-beta hydrolase superfamily lysophospholipase
MDRSKATAMSYGSNTHLLVAKPFSEKTTMKKFLRIFLISIAGFAGLYFSAALILIYLPEPTFAVDPFPVTGITTADHEALHFTARDGENLFARRFPAESDLTILLLHGATSDSAAFNASAQMLQQASGAEVIALDLRGHGQSGGAPGDVDYTSQYEDDVVDVITTIRSQRPDNRIILAGHSMGGGIALRFALLADHPAVDGYLLFSPHLGTNAPTMPPANPDTAGLTAAYTQLHVPRLIGLGMLNWAGITAFNRLDTLYFNLTDEVTHIYSYRAMLNTSPFDYVAVLSAVDAPLLVLVGSNDEAFVADQYPIVIGNYSDGEVHIIPGETHTTIVESAAVMPFITKWLSNI